MRSHLAGRTLSRGRRGDSGLSRISEGEPVKARI